VNPCPQCGEPAERGQLVCTNCGARLALDYRRPQGAVPALAITLAVVVLGAGAFGFAVSEITSDAEDEVMVADRAERPAPVAAQGEQQRDAPEATAPSAGTAEGTPQEPSRSLLLEWPDDLTAHTVVLVTTSDRHAAGRRARQAARSGIEAGLLRSDDYNLGTGLWIVFAGRFDTPEGATRQASDLAERFPGAYPQLVEPTG
jgi:zinc-ribbon domain